MEEAELARGVALARGRDLVRPTAAGGRRGTRRRASAWRARYKPRGRRYLRRLRRGTGTVPLESNRNRRLLAGARSLPHPYAVAQPPARPRRAPKSDPRRALSRGRRRAAGAGIWPRARRAGPRGPAARRAPRPGHRGAGRARPVRARGAHPPTHDRPPPRRPGPDARAGRGARAARRGDRVIRPRPRGLGREGLHALLPARQPRRGAAADPRPAHPGPQGAAAGRSTTRSATPSRRLVRAHGRDAVDGARRRARRPPGADGAPHRGPAPHAARRPAPHPAPARPARRPAHDARTRTPTCGAACARRSPCCGTPATCARSRRRRSTRSASELAIFDETLFIAVPRFQRPSTGRSTRAAAGDAGRRARRRRRPDRHPPVARAGAAPVRVVDRRGPRRPPGRHARHHAPRGPRSRPTTCCAATRPSRSG